MQVQDIVRFNKEHCFNGAVQTEWFYDQTRVKEVAESYVFHGPKYFGVSGKDIDLSGHRLVDTASFTLNIARKLNDSKPDHNFIMTIAGYGAGKSHLAVSLGALFSGNLELRKTILHNLAIADKDIADEVEAISSKKNYILVLNGMNNFNLDAEILKTARLVLSDNNLSDDVLRELTRSYDIARQFVQNMFDLCRDKFEQRAGLSGLKRSGEQLKKYLLANVEADNNALSIISDVYSDLTGDSISWDRGLSAGDILSVLSQNLCGQDKPFNKILILFDEFGRYIEYTAANPAIAGEAALQQIFEAVQTANGKIIFTGFVQSELDAYLARIDKSSNIMRYVGRFKASENLYLSSNFETILANLLVKKDESLHEQIVGAALKKYERQHDFVKEALNRWDRSSSKKSVWTDNYLYKSVILKGCYPLHPITVWLLSNMNNWMQQRSAITFAAEMVERISKKDVSGNYIPYVYPINIIDSGIYEEMLNSEEKGLVQSQYCLLFRSILIKIGDKLSDNEKQALKAVLITKIGKFSFSRREAAINALRYCSNLREEYLIEAINHLENYHGVIAYDENANTFDLIAEANGFNEFRIAYSRYKLSAVQATINDCDENLLKELSLLSDVETSFGQTHHIASQEWKFRKVLVDTANVTESYLSTRIRELENDCSGNGYKGQLFFVYCSKAADRQIDMLSSIYRKLSLAKKPIVLLFLDDSEGEIIKALTIKEVINRFSRNDFERFEKHIRAQIKKQNKIIINKFNSLVQSRKIINEKGLQIYQGRINALCSQVFETLYTDTPPFMFDGFEKKTQAAARRYLADICMKISDRTLLNVQNYNAIPTEEKNRIRATLATGSETSWKVYSDNCTLIKPMNMAASKVFDVVEASLSADESLSIMQVFGQFLKPPYGMNINAIVLFAFYYMAYKDRNLLCYYEKDKLRPEHISDKIFKGLNLQEKEFRKIRLQINANADVDLVRELCDEIMECTLVEECAVYKKKLDDLLAQELLTPNDQLLVASARTRLDDGISYNNSIYDKCKKGEDILAEVKKAFGVQKFAKVFDYFIDTTKPLSNDLPFVYSKEFIRRMDALKTEAEILAKKWLSSAIQKFGCSEITKLSNYKHVCANIQKKFNEHGYNEYATELKNHVVDVEQSLLTKQKYQDQLVEIDKDIAMIKGATGGNYSTYNDYLEKMVGWEHFLKEQTDFTSNVLDQYLKKVLEMITFLQNTLQELSASCKDLLERIQSISNYAELLSVKEKLKVISDSEYPEDLADQVKTALFYIDQSENYVNTIPEKLDELREMLNGLNDTLYGPCIYFVRTSLKAAIDALENRQKNWVSRFISVTEGNIDKMTAIDCSNWMDRTGEIPSYLDSETVKRYSALYDLVNQRLHESRIEGVLVMYTRLNKDEQDEFRRRIGM